MGAAGETSRPERVTGCFPGSHLVDDQKPLTFLAVNLKVCRGGVVVRVMLVDLFVEALSVL